MLLPSDPIWRRLLNRTATPDGQNRPPLGRKKWPVCLHSLALALFLLLQQQQQQLPAALQSVPALSKPRRQHHPDSRHVKYSSLCRTERDRCGPENKRVAGQKCVNNSLLDALKISPNSKRVKKPHTHNPKTSALLTSQPGQFHSAAWVFCTNNFTVPKWKRQTSAWFSYKWFWNNMKSLLFKCVICKLYLQMWARTSQLPSQFLGRKGNEGVSVFNRKTACNLDV